MEELEHVLHCSIHRLDVTPTDAHNTPGLRWEQEEGEEEVEDEGEEEERMESGCDLSGPAVEKLLLAVSPSPLGSRRPS